MVGTTHSNAAALLSLGVNASDGVEQVAETGGTGIITQEINTLIGAGFAYERILGSGLGTGPGTITINDVGVDVNFPFITLLTMIAPSPDWIAQVNNLKLTDASNDWLSSISVDVYATDAGTDGGTTYTSGNANTSPRDPISSLENTLPFSDQIIGTFIFTLEEVLGVDDAVLANAISVYPNPSAGAVYVNNTSAISINKASVFATNGKIIKEFKVFLIKINSIFLHCKVACIFLS